MKPDSHKVIYGTGNLCTQVDYILTRRSDLKQVHNVKLIGDVLPNITVFFQDKFENTDQKTIQTSTKKTCLEITKT